MQQEMQQQQQNNSSQSSQRSQKKHSTMVNNMYQPSSLSHTQQNQLEKILTLKSRLQQFQSKLSAIGYKGQFNQDKALKGHSSVYLPILHFSLLIYSQPVSDYIKQHNFDMLAKNDYQFIATVINVLKSLFKYRCQFTADTFFSEAIQDNNHANQIKDKQMLVEMRIQFVEDVLKLVQDKHASLITPNHKKIAIHTQPSSRSSSNNPSHHQQSKRSSSSSSQKLPKSVTFEDQVLNQKNKEKAIAQSNYYSTTNRGKNSKHQHQQHSSDNNKKLQEELAAKNMANFKLNHDQINNGTVQVANLRNQNHLQMQHTPQQQSQQQLKPPSMIQTQMIKTMSHNKIMPMASKNSSSNNNNNNNGTNLGGGGGGASNNEYYFRTPPMNSNDVNHSQVKQSGSSSKQANKSKGDSRPTSTSSATSQDKQQLHAQHRVTSILNDKNQQDMQLQVDTLTRQNIELVQLVSSLQHTIKNLSTQMTNLQSSTDHQLTKMAEQNIKLEARVNQQEHKLKKYKNMVKSCQVQLDQRGRNIANIDGKDLQSANNLLRPAGQFSQTIQQTKSASHLVTPQAATQASHSERNDIMPSNKRISTTAPQKQKRAPSANSDHQSNQMNIANVHQQLSTAPTSQQNTSKHQQQ